MNQERILGLIVVALVIGVLGGYWYGRWTGDAAGYDRARNEFSANLSGLSPVATGGTDNQTAGTGNPLAEVKTNPFDDVKFNPFE